MTLLVKSTMLILIWAYDFVFCCQTRALSLFSITMAANIPFSKKLQAKYYKMRRSMIWRLPQLLQFEMQYLAHYLLGHCYQHTLKNPVASTIVNFLCFLWLLADVAIELIPGEFPWCSRSAKEMNIPSFPIVQFPSLLRDSFNSRMYSVLLNIFLWIRRCCQLVVA